VFAIKQEASEIIRMWWCTKEDAIKVVLLCLFIFPFIFVVQQLLAAGSEYEAHEKKMNQAADEKKES
jgi:hypothetical protein